METLPQILIIILVLAAKAASQQTPVPGWHLSGSNRFSYVIGIDPEKFHSGFASAAINCVSRCEGFGTLMQRVPALDYLSKRLRFAAWVTTNKHTAKPRIWMRVDGAGGKLQAFDNMDHRAKRGPFDWQQQVIVLDVPQSAEFIYCGLILDGPATAWIDDITLEIVDVNTKLTGFQYVPVGRKGRKEKQYSVGTAAGEHSEGASIVGSVATAQRADPMLRSIVAHGIINAGFEDGGRKEH